MRTAWSRDDHNRALDDPRALSDELARSHPGAAASLGENLEETLTVTRLGVRGRLKRTLASTNPCESMIETVRRISRKRRRWQNGDMCLRGIAAGTLETEQPHDEHSHAHHDRGSRGRDFTRLRYSRTGPSRARVRLAVHRSGARMASNAVPARVLAEGMSHLVGRGPPAQLRDAPALQDGLAIDGVLKPFQRRLQVLDAYTTEASTWSISSGIPSCGPRRPRARARPRLGRSRRRI